MSLEKTLLEAQLFDLKNFLLTIIATTLEHIWDCIWEKVVEPKNVFFFFDKNFIFKLFSKVHFVYF